MWMCLHGLCMKCSGLTPNSLSIDSRYRVQGSFEARDSQMKEYLWVVKQVMDKFCMTKVVQMA